MTGKKLIATVVLSSACTAFLTVFGMQYYYTHFGVRVNRHNDPQAQMVNYDDFMLNKIPMFPKNTYFQKYYENIFPKRIFDTKIFYYLPNDCKKISIRYIDETTNDISRTITYYFINNSIALIRDQLDGWFGNIYNHYHTLESEKINDYMEILNNYNIHSDNINIIKY